MLLVDRRTGSVDLAPDLERMGLPVTVTTLEAGDVAFAGRGNEDTPLAIGIELKKLTTSDLTSSLMTGRLNEQGGKMLGVQGHYDYGWLVVEGRYRVGRDGRILVKKGRRKYRAQEWEPIPGLLASVMAKRVLTLELCGGFHVRFTDDRAGTLHFIDDLYRWFTDKPMDEHRSNLQPYVPPTKPWATRGLVEEVAARFPGIGWGKAVEVGKEFDSVREMVNADPSRWMRVAGIGKTIAEAVVAAICRKEKR